MKRTTASLSQGVHYERMETISGVRFTPREIDLIACLLSGKATKAVAHFLSIEEKTVDTHKYNIMRKLECNSKESIINFIEKSDKFSIVKKHYLDLLIQRAFETHLQEILALIGKNVVSCLIVYWKEQGNKSSFINELETYLKLAGMTISVERREDYKSLNHLVHKIESQPIDYVLYVPSVSLIDALQAGDSQGKLEIFPFIQKYSKDPGSVIFLLREKDTVKNLPQEIQDAGYVDFTQQEDYYFSLLDILRRILPDIPLETIIAGFKKRCEIIYGSSEKAFPHLWPEEREIIQKESPARNNTFSLKKYRMGLFAVGGIFLCILCLCLLAFLLKGNKPLLPPQPDKISEFLSVRSELPIPQDNVLLERSNLITEIEAQFKKGQQDIKALTLVGIGGSGKTIIARQYARRQDGMVWEIHAETRRSLRESFESFAYLLAATEEAKRILMGMKDIRDPEEKEEKILLFVKEKLKSFPHWLLIFDNVEKFPDIEKYFPSDPAVWGRGEVIITTRNSNMETHSSVHQSVPVKELTPEEKLTLFTRILNTGDAYKFTPLEKEKARVFLNALPSFPLDVSVAAYYLKATDISYGEYIKNISEYKSGFDSVQSNILNEVGAYSHTRYKIITLSLEKIMKESKDFGEILLFISLIDSHNIPKELLDRFKNSIEIDNFIYHLKKYSLATHNLLSASTPVSCVTIHRSTQDIALAYLAREMKLDKGSPLLKDIFHVLDNYMDKALEEEDFLRMKVSASHAEMFVKHTDLLPGFITGLIESKLGCMYYFLNDQARAQKTIEASLIRLEDHLSTSAGEGDTQVAQAFLHIGNVYTELSNYEKAKILLEKSLWIYNKAPSKDYLKVSWGLSHIANAYRRSGYYTKAKDLLEESLALQNQCSFKNHGRIARTLACLGSVYRGLGRYEQSIQTLEQSLKLYKQHFPEEHFRVGWVLCHLGNIYRKLGHYEESIKVLEEGLKIYRKHFSENHINVGLMLTYLGNSYRGLGNYEKAKSLLEEGLRIHEKHFKEGHERIGRILFHLGNVYRDLGDYGKSGVLFRKALAIYENNHGKGEIEMARRFRNMGGIHLLENRLEDAKGMIHKSLEILKRHKHPETYISLESLAGLSLKKSQQAAKERNNIQSQYFKDQAINQLNQALKIMERHFPEDSAHIQKIRSKIKKVKESSSF